MIVVRQMIVVVEKIVMVEMIVGIQIIEVVEKIEVAETIEMIVGIKEMLETIVECMIIEKMIVLLVMWMFSKIVNIKVNFIFFFKSYLLKFCLRIKVEKCILF